MSERIKISAWVTKYALTAGIYEVEGIVSSRSPDMLGVDSKQALAGTSYFHGEGRDWHRTRESAVRRAEEMRKAKIASVKKQLLRLQALRFEDHT